MGTVVSIDVRTLLPPDRLDAAIDAAVAVLHQADADLSTFRPDSWVSRMRSGACTLSDCPEHIQAIYRAAEACRARTGGLFDPGWRRDGTLDPTGLVKGWAADAASWALTRASATAHCVNAAGDLRVRGLAAPGVPWRLGIADPARPGHLVAVVEGSDLAVATSGTRERGAHVIDPRTGTGELAVAHLCHAWRRSSRPGTGRRGHMVAGVVCLGWRGPCLSGVPDSYGLLLASGRMVPASLRDIDRNRVRAVVGEATFRRGEQYARRGAVAEVSWQPSGNTLIGRVAGSNGKRYSTTAYFVEGDQAHPWQFRGGNCSCPMALDCKHTAALVLAAAQAASLTAVAKPAAERWTDSMVSGTAAPARAQRGGAIRPVTPPPTWASTLTDLLGETSSPKGPGRTTPLAIELSLSDEPAAGRRPPAGPSLRVMARLVQQGKTGWISAPTWSQLNAPYGRYHHSGHHEAQLRILREIHAVYQAGDSSSPYPRYGEEKYLDLGEFHSPRLWPLLDEARAAGVELVHQRKRMGSVEPYTSAEFCLDITRTSRALTLRPVLQVSDSDVDLAPFAFIGRHGVVAIDRAEIQTTDQHENWHLRLARLTSPVPPALVRMAVANQRMRIPAADQPRFLVDFYPRLARLARIVSSDGSFEPPALPRPTLVARATFGPDHTVQLDWEWDYSVGDLADGDLTDATAADAALTDGDPTSGNHEIGALRRRVPLQADGPDAGYRDHAAEAEILSGLNRSELPANAGLGLAALGQVGAGVAGVAGVGATGGPAATVLRGMDTMRLSTQLLPRLTALDGVIVEIGGDPLDYRDASDTLRIEVSTDAVPGEPDWFDLSVAVRLDGQLIPFPPVFEALSRDEPYLLLDDGAFLRLDRPELHSLRRLIEEAAALRDNPAGPLRISRFQAGLWEELVALGVIGHQAEQWRTQVESILAFETAGAKEPPDTLRASLRPYQVDGFRWLTFLWDCGLGGILADDMGLGKTLQSLALICHARRRDPALPPFLIIAPTSVVGNWAAEAARFAPRLRVATLTDTLRRRGQSLDDITATADVVITSYTLFRLDTEDYSAAAWAGLILDEAQTVKNHQSKAYQCARLLPAPFKLAVTGTPLENNVMELWSLLSITAPGLFPNRTRFHEYYARPIEKQGDAELLGQLRRRIRPLVTRRTKEQVAPDLPAKQEQVIDVDLHPRHRRAYQVRLQRERQRVLGLVDDMNRNRFTILQSLTTLRQLSLHAGLVDDAHDAIASAKIDVLLEQLRDVVDGGHRALVFSQFTRFLGKVRDALDAAGIEYCYLDGATRDRPAVLRRFKSGTVPVFLISLKAGGTGLNLTEADYCFLLDPWWNPATEAQAVDRTHRIGQTRNVMVYRLVARDTIEEKVMALKVRKAELFASIMDGGDFVDTTLDADDIRQLLS
ncbi:SNF2-related protein [Frankia sp. AiPa1]|uniref:SNF2-related protein n=1 Tax=Frankia sp. AiPa1 TaxID=573492 RepID=UPI00202B1E1E|nr:SNF2-related protein [Frankia sp. AiPa1]MCL9759965.1 SNF2-related protein [Frankia sp. AiPa1]